MHLELSLKHWFNYEVFTWQWWGKFVYLIIPIILLYKLLDRKRIFELASYGLMISLISNVLDVIGVNFVLWTYPIRFLPTGFFAIHDLVVITITSMLVYQYCFSWKSFIVANIILSAMGAYIKDPLLTLINVYKQINWNHTYSFVLFLIMSIICKYIINILKNSYQRSLTHE